MPSVAMEVDSEQINEEDRAVMEQKRANEEYKVWKKNSIYLYDTVISHALEWPTLTCQWFPDMEKVPGKGYATHRLLLGTHTSDEDQNYVQIASVNLPIMPDKVDIGRYNDESGEIGGYGGPGSGEARIQITQKIDHEGEVNKARYMPQNPNMIATLGSRGDVLVFDRTMHANMPTGVCNPQIRLVGHKAEGWGLCWSPLRQGLLLTAAEDVRLWDINAVTSAKGARLDQSIVFKSHTAGVNDVAWHPLQPTWFGSVSDDTHLNIHDTRSDDRNKPTHTTAAHAEPVNCLAFNPVNQYVVATGASDSTLALWDLRNIKTRIHTLEGHTGDVQSINWHPTEETVLASAATDRRLLLWDLSKIGEEQTEEDKEDGPPELFFLHGGHTDLIHDFSWNLHQPWTIASAAQDNIVQIFQPAHNIIGEEASVDEAELE